MIWNVLDTEFSTLAVNDDRWYVDANAAACDLLQRNVEALRRLRIDDLAVNGGDVDEAWSRFLAEGRQAGRCELRRGDGGLVRVDFVARARVRPGCHVSILQPATTKTPSSWDILPTLPGRVAVLDASGTIVATNLAWTRAARIHGAQATTGVGTNYLRVCERAGEEGRAASEGLRKIFEGRAELVRVEYLCVTASSEQWYEMLASATRDGGALVLHVEITSRKLLQTRLLDLEAAARAKDAGLALVSHELRGPLSAILTWANVLKHERPDSGRVGRVVEAIERNVRLENRLVADLLDVSRALSGRLGVERRRTDVAAVVEAAVDTVRSAVREKGLVLTMRVDPDVPPVLGDAERLQQVCWNLLTNSVKFTAAPGRIEVGLARAGDRATLWVSDTGRGIAPDILSRVFEPFVQASTGEAGGLGLGLAIVRHIVELHGGRVEVESGEHGSRFTVSLPIAGVTRTTGSA